jgi:glyoxylase-like metal-dependent hydrolase (beta-lactamase superfamily II)
MQPILIPAGNASAWTGPTGNNTYLLSGRVPTLIDAGVGNPAHLDAVARELGGRDLALVLITHGHVDHVSGVPALTERWPGVRVRQFGTGAAPLADREPVEAGDSILTTYHTPGHARDHCCFSTGADLFCGDLVRIGGSVVIPASRGGNLAEYLASLRLVRDLAPRRLFPGHGPMIDDPPRIVDEYLRHREAREAQVLNALEARCETPADIVKRIYPGLDHGLVVAAAESVLAHLIKLRDEGRVVEAEGRWKRVQAG